MIDMFQPLKYDVASPAPDEILLLQNSSIEKYFINNLNCHEYMLSAEGFFRAQARRPSTGHGEYVLGKSLAIYEIIKNLNPDGVIIRIDYFLNSNLMIGVYVREDLRLMIGCIKGYRADKMSEAEYQKL